MQLSTSTGVKIYISLTFTQAKAHGNVSKHVYKQAHTDNRVNISIGYRLNLLSKLRY